MRRKSALLLLLPVLAALAAAAPPPSREIAITFDDLPLGGPEVGLARIRPMTAALLATLKQEGVTAVGFVNEGKLYKPGEIDERTAVLKDWLDAGHELGNHTFSHPSFQETPLAAFQEDVIRGETVTRMLLAEKGRTLRYFRHPFLRTGPTMEARAAFEKFLAERGYTVGPVTVENADYVYNAVYTRAKTKGDAETMRRMVEGYVRFTEAQLDFQEGIAQKLVGRPIRHVLLLHANELNAEALDELLDLFKRRGYRFVTLERALEDDAYRLPDTYAGRAGVHWPFRWARSLGIPIDWTQEPEPPEDVQKLYEAAQAR